MKLLLSNLNKLTMDVNINNDILALLKTLSCRRSYFILVKYGYICHYFSRIKINI